MLALVRKLIGATSFLPRTATLLNVVDPTSGSIIDRCLVQFFPAPHSYTGEDLCEISCHGSPVVAGRLLESLVRLGARIAEPGEFTLRAFLNGKMDLAQAEAVRDLVEAQTDYQARIAREQMEGGLSRALQPLKQQLVEVISLLETAVEFVEDDVGEIPRTVQAERLDELCARLAEMEGSYRFGRFIHDGFRLAILGRPNVGKSSLFNSLLESDRAIVTEIPGTTRDAITESIHVHGIPVRVTDTAGIRQPADRVEQIGIERSHRAAGEADILLVVLDASQPVTPEDEALVDRLKQQCGIIVWNKIDLLSASQVANLESHFTDCGSQVAGRRSGERATEHPPESGLPATSSDEPASVRVSALTGAGIGELRQTIYDALSGDTSLGQQGLIVTSLRHRDCMTRARGALQEGIAALRQNMSEEFALYHIRLGLRILGEITGETTVEEILDKIFATFCIGK
jgi:tRNA modification GTPase